MLDCYTKQLINTLDILFESNEFVTIQELINQLSCDRKTIINYCKVLNSEFPEIKIVKNKGIKMRNDYSGYTELRNKLILQCFNVRLLEYIFLNKEPTLQKICNHFYISEASIRRSIHEINIFLYQFDVKIKSKNEIFYFYGSEESIRYTACVLFVKYDFCSKWPFKNIPKSEVDKVLKKILKDSYALLSEHIKLKWMYILVVCLIRCNQKYYLLRNCFECDRAKNTFIEQAKKSLKQWKFTYEETDFLFYLIQTSPVFFEQMPLGKSILSWHKESKTDIYILTQTIINELDALFFYGQEVDEYLLELLILSGVVKSTLFPTSEYLLNGCKVSYLMNKNVKLCEKVEMLLEKITPMKKFNKEWIKISVVDALYAVFFKEEGRTINILLRTELSYGRTSILKRKISLLLSARYCVHFVDNVYCGDEPVYIISTLYRKYENEENIIFVRESLPPEDIKKLYLFIS